MKEERTETMEEELTRGNDWMREEEEKTKKKDPRGSEKGNVVKERAERKQEVGPRDRERREEVREGDEAEGFTGLVKKSRAVQESLVPQVSFTGHAGMSGGQRAEAEGRESVRQFGARPG